MFQQRFFKFAKLIIYLTNAYNTLLLLISTEGANNQITFRPRHVTFEWWLDGNEAELVQSEVQKASILVTVDGHG